MVVSGVGSLRGRISLKVSGMLTTVSGSRTDTGLLRVLNEDSLLDGPQLWSVADGMGGHAAGDVASRLVIESLRRLGSSERAIRPPELASALAEANAAILAYADEHPRAAGMGSTVAGVAQVSVGDEPHWVIFNVGDSRVYRCFGGSMARATTDHSEVEEMVLDGRITEDEARTHRLRNVITRSMGTDPAPQVDTWVLPQTPGERFLVCSDGLTTELTDPQIAEILLGVADPGQAAELLLSQALAAGGRDNVSVIVVDLLGEAESDLDEQTLPRVRVDVPAFRES